MRAAGCLRSSGPARLEDGDLLAERRAGHAEAEALARNAAAIDTCTQRVPIGRPLMLDHRRCR